MKTLIITGAPAAAFVPSTLATIELQKKMRDEWKLVVTESAKRWVTKDALQRYSHGDVYENTFGSFDHVSLAEQSSRIYVYPATSLFITKLCVGLTDNPAVMTVLMASKKTTLFPSFPPYMENQATTVSYREQMVKAGINVIEPEVSTSLSNGTLSPGGCASPQELWTQLEKD